MPIKDKDGKVFRLRGPNPVMENQQFWNKEALVYYNMQFETLTMPDSKRTIAHKIKEHTHHKPVPQFVPEPVPEPVVKPVQILELPPIPEIEVEITPVRQEMPQTVTSRLVWFHYLPVERKKVEDRRYATINYISTYGEKSKFQGIVVDETELALVFWTEAQLKEKSIVCPMNYSKCCFRVEENEEKSGGYVYTCSVSDINPDFS